jgi:thiamine-monophosphate kinase
MPPGEFALIDRWFRPLDGRAGQGRPDVLLGIGDDAALLQPPAGQWLVAALDTLVEGRHFPPGSEPRSIGHRALAVNLSDLAAMGATPAWALLGLTLPSTTDEAWLQAFAEGLGTLAARHGVALVGGDTTGGPLTLSVQVLGFVPPGMALRRDAGQPGDLVCVSGQPGEAALGLRLLQHDATLSGAGTAAQRQQLRRRFEHPEPRLALGLALRGVASACIDVSDGLAADAAKLARASGCGLELHTEALPLSAAMCGVAGVAAAREAALGGGDDYELCFTLPPSREPELATLAARAGCALTVIGQLTADPALRLLEQGKPRSAPWQGFDHFAAERSE